MSQPTWTSGGWYIDPVSGSDENSGRAETDALRTMHEYHRRMVLRDLDAVFANIGEAFPELKKLTLQAKTSDEAAEVLADAMEDRGQMTYARILRDRRFRAADLEELSSNIAHEVYLMNDLPDDDPIVLLHPHTTLVGVPRPGRTHVRIGGGGIRVKRAPSPEPFPDLSLIPVVLRPTPSL